MSAVDRPDLAALRSMCEIRLNGRGPNESRVEAYAASGRWLANRPDQILAVLDLVAQQQAENERLRRALTRLRDYGALNDEFVRLSADVALAGSSANPTTSEGGEQ